MLSSELRLIYVIFNGRGYRTEELLIRRGHRWQWTIPSTGERSKGFYPNKLEATNSLLVRIDALEFIHLL